MQGQGIDLAIARLRLLLADLSARESDLQAARRQYREQIERIVGFSLYGEGDVGSALGLLAEVEERLQALEVTARHVALLKARAEAELESLQLARGIEAARAELADLRARQSSSAPGESADAIAREIRRLESAIAEMSQQAARTLERRRSP